MAVDDDDDDLFGDAPVARVKRSKKATATASSSLLDSMMAEDAKKASKLEAMRLANAASREKIASISESKSACCEPAGGSSSGGVPAIAPVAVVHGCSY